MLFHSVPGWSGRQAPAGGELIFNTRGFGMKGMNIRRRHWAIAAGIAASAAAVGSVVASDHQDTPEVELSPRSDINDVYAFPSGLTSADNLTLVMTTSSPIGPTVTSARFDPELLYQFKIDNTGDGVEDRVIQITFGKDTTIGGTTGQAVFVRGPAAPAAAMAPDGSPATPPLTGTAMVQLRNVPVTTGVVGNASGFTGTGALAGLRVFAGLRDDPFFLDLEQFLRILPDRRPVTGVLSQDPTRATGFRNPGRETLSQFKFNALGIVIELPESLLVGTGTAGQKLGVWATISR